MTSGLSVVVTVQRGQDAGPCLASLLAQEQASLQIIAVHEPGSPIAAHEPAVEVLQSRSASLPIMIGTGLGAATMPYVALTEGHCTFAPGWATAALGARETSGAAVIGGTVRPAANLSPLEQGLFYADYGAFLPPCKPRLTSDLPGNNIVFRRDLVSGDFARTGFWKTFHCRDLEKRGERLCLDPSFTAIYGRRIGLRAMLRRRFDHGRCFGAMRAARMTVWHRLAYAVVTPILPIALTLRVGKHLRRKAGHRLACIRVAHWVLLAMFAWVGGEMAGNVGGAGSGCSRL